MAEQKLAYSNYPFLAELDLHPENIGCYHSNKWEANGEYMYSYNPHNNEAIAKIKQATEKDYEQCIQSMIRGKAAWMTVNFYLKKNLIKI